VFSQNLYLKIDGYTDSETTVIDSLNYVKNHQDYTSIKLEVDAIQNTLYKLGYIENELKDFNKKNDSTFYSLIHLKEKFNTIYIYYNKQDIDNSILNMISKNVFDNYFELDFTEVENALAFINSKISAKGLPFSKLYLSNIKIKDSSNLESELIIESSKQKRTINNIIIKGYEKFPKSYLKHYLKIKPKQVFDLKRIRNKTEQLNNLNFANEVKSPEVLFSKDSTSLYLYLEKAKSNAFDGFLGFGTNEKTNRLEFDGYLNLNLTNNLNYGESFRLLYKSDENDQKTFETNISLPYLFKSPIGIDLLLRIFKRDSSFTTINQSVKLHYQINSKHKVYAGIISTESNNLLKENFSLTINDYNTKYYTFAYQFLKPQSSNLLFPVNSKLYFITNFGNRKTTNKSEKQSQFTINAFKIFNLNPNNSFYLRINGSNLISPTYFENELIRFGGINSIRGFEENSLFSSLYGLINTEYRFQLNKSIYVHSIIDAAYFENKIINTKEKLFGYGFGFGILTKAGLFKFNYANGKTENNRFKLSNSKIHLSLTTSF
jgi:hypothetical protein